MDSDWVGALERAVAISLLWGLLAIAAILALAVSAELLLVFRQPRSLRFLLDLLDRFRRIGRLLTFRESRRVLRRRGNLGPAILIGVAYALVSMYIGTMLEVFPTSKLAFFWEVIWYGRPSWDYPAVLIAGPNEVLAFPFLPTVTMVLVSAGVAFGAGVALASLRSWRRERRSTVSTGTAVRTSAGIAPSVTGLATLGACCCVSCVTAGGVAVVAAASGTSYNNLLANNWYVDLFQIVVVWLSLVVQERSLRNSVTRCVTVPATRVRLVLSNALRMALLVAGITWSLAMFVELAGQPPGSAGLVTWYHWVFEHQLLSFVAVIAAIAPSELSAFLSRVGRRVGGWSLRLALAIGGLSWGLWVPPQLTRMGLGGFLNELAGYLGLPSGAGAIPPEFPLGAALMFHWAFQHVLLGAFAVAIAVSPSVALAPLLAGTPLSGPEGSGTPYGAPGSA